AGRNRLRNLVARQRLGIRRHRILEVEDDAVGGEIAGLFQRPCVGTGHEQQAAARTDHGLVSVRAMILSRYHFEQPAESLVPVIGLWLAMVMTPFPQHLIDGYRTFTTQRLPTEQSRYRELSERGQSPEVMVIGCCDSRVSPEVIFDAGPGELFVVRNVANLVPVYQPDSGAHGVSAALEYAVSVLRVKHIVVLGHAQCGGIRAFIDNNAPLSPGDFIGKWMAMFIKRGEQFGRPDHETMQDFTVRIEKAAVFRSLENLMAFPFVRTPVERGEISLHGAYFCVAEGSLFVLDQAIKEFRSVGNDAGELTMANNASRKAPR